MTVKDYKQEKISQSHIVRNTDLPTQERSGPNSASVCLASVPICAIIANPANLGHLTKKKKHLTSDPNVCHQRSQRAARSQQFNTDVINDIKHNTNTYCTYRRDSPALEKSFDPYLYISGMFTWMWDICFFPSHTLISLLLVRLFVGVY